MPTKRKQIGDPRILEAANHIHQVLGPGQAKRGKLRLAIILGSGLGDFADTLEVWKRIPFSSVPHFPSASVSGHSGRLVFGEIGGIPICCFQGRVHYYENFDMKTVTFPIRVLGSMGIRWLIVTNAAGAINSSLRPGDFLLIRDHLGLFLPNPLLGANLDSFGPRFPDMSDCYSRRLRQLTLKCASRLKLSLKQGVYAGISGPSYETPAEIKMLKKMGADAVGMSTVPEVIVARHMGIECLGISVITNRAAGISGAPLSHEEVLEASQRMKPQLIKLLSLLSHEIPKLL